MWIRSDEGLTLETSAFRISVRWPIYIINSVDKTKFLYTDMRRPILNLFPFLVNMFALPTMSLLSLPTSLSTPSTSPFLSLESSSVSCLLSLQQPFIGGPRFFLLTFKRVSQIVAVRFIDLAEFLSVNLRESES